MPMNRRLWLLLFVLAIAGLQMFMKIGPWFFVGTGVFLALTVGYTALTIGREYPHAPPNPNYLPFVSVIIPAHNEESVISQTIEQAFKLRYNRKGKRNYEVWVIDDRSTDKTRDVLYKLKKSHKALHVLSRSNNAYPGKSAALNDCLPLTKGEVLLILDADAHFPVDLISRVVPYLSASEVGGAQVAKKIANPETNILCSRQSDEYKIDISIQLGRDTVGGAVEFKGNGTFVKRNALETVGGWTNHTLTDDLDLSTKMLLGGYRIRFVPDTTVWEQAAPDLKGFFKQRLRWIEGSMMRYLEYLPRILRGPMQPRQRFDMIMFLLEYAVPVYVLFDLLSQFVWQFTLGYLRLGNLGLVMLATIVTFCGKLISSYAREHRYNFWQILGRTFLTMIYMGHWFPVVIAATFNLMLGLESRTWKKVQRVRSEEIIRKI